MVLQNSTQHRPVPQSSGRSGLPGPAPGAAFAGLLPASLRAYPRPHARAVRLVESASSPPRSSRYRSGGRACPHSPLAGAGAARRCPPVPETTSRSLHHPDRQPAGCPASMPRTSPGPASINRGRFCRGYPCARCGVPPGPANRSFRGWRPTALSPPAAGKPSRPPAGQRDTFSGRALPRRPSPSTVQLSSAPPAVTAVIPRKGPKLRHE